MASIGIAGPVQDNEVKAMPPGISFEKRNIKADELAQAIKVKKVLFFNDFEVNAL